MTVEQDAFAYEYANVGLPVSVVPDGHAYEYANIGSFPVPSVIGRLLYIGGPSKEARAYEYVNIEEESP